MLRVAKCMGRKCDGGDQLKRVDVWGASLYTKQTPKISSKKFWHAMNVGHTLINEGTRIRAPAYRRGTCLIAQAYIAAGNEDDGLRN